MKDIITTDFHAQIVADSVNQFDNRLTTFVITFPRIILAEFNTHRMLSRNSASSRAIPFEKMLQRVEKHPFVPIKWMKDHKGMQGNEYFGESYQDFYILEELWLEARDRSIKQAKVLSSRNLTKQIVNRLLEPWMWHTVIVTASEWQNFFALRAHEAAEIHMQKIAHMMLEEYNRSTPKQLKPGRWHIPFGDNIDCEELWQVIKSIYPSGTYEYFSQPYEVRVATARCARVSYLNFEGKDDYNADIKLHDRLAKMGHWSPFEHCAQSMSNDEYYGHHLTQGKNDPFDENGKDFFGVSGNFRGFIQYRKMFETENKQDLRVCQK